MKCPHCNQEHPDGFQFCPVTGKRIDALKACTYADCPKFGQYVLPVNFNFCPECGKPIASDGSGSKQSFQESTNERVGQYEEIDSFYEGLARVKKNGKYGYIDIFGNEVIECKYINAKRFSEGLAYVGGGTFIDKYGQIALRVKENLYVYGIFSEGLCLVQEDFGDDRWEDEKYGLHGFIDRNGDLVIECQFEEAKDFHDGYAVVWEETDDDKKIFRFIDRDGNDAFGSFDSVTEFKGGYAVVQEKQYESWEDDCCTMKTKIIDTDGYTVFDDFPEDMGSIADASYGRYSNNLNDGIIYLTYGFGEHSHFVWIDIDCKTRHEKYTNDLSYCYGGFSEGFTIIGDARQGVGFMNIEGNVVIQRQYQDAKLFSEGLAAVKRNDLWGYIDVNGNIVIPFEYSEAKSFKDGRAVVAKDNKLMVINDKGCQIV